MQASERHTSRRFQSCAAQCHSDTELRRDHDVAGNDRRCGSYVAAGTVAGSTPRVAGARAALEEHGHVRLLHDSRLSRVSSIWTLV